MSEFNLDINTTVPPSLRRILWRPSVPGQAGNTWEERNNLDNISDDTFAVIKLLTFQQRSMKKSIIILSQSN
jgi:hypothetical protein